jgi:hypothetical protein
MFRAFTGPLSGVSLAVAMLPFGSNLFLTVHGTAATVRKRMESNGSIATAQDTPDDGPVKARNMYGEKKHKK